MEGLLNSGIYRAQSLGWFVRPDTCESCNKSQDILDYAGNNVRDAVAHTDPSVGRRTLMILPSRNGLRKALSGGR